MDDIITSYLAQNRYIALQGLGEFLVRNKSSRLEFPEKKMKAPYQKIYFDKKDVQYEKQFLSYVGRLTGTDEKESVQRLNDWIENLKNSIAEKGVVKLPFGGNLSGIVNGELEYSVGEAIFRMDDVSAKRIIRNRPSPRKEEEITSEEKAGSEAPSADKETSGISFFQKKWKVAALVLFILSVILILISIFANNLVPKIKAREAPATYISR